MNAVSDYHLSINNVKESETISEKTQAKSFRIYHLLL
jgi:hypothetical protein